MGPTRVPYGILYGSYMGTLYGTEMGFELGFLGYPHGQIHMGHKREQYRSYSGFVSSGPCPTNLCRIDFALILYIFVSLSV